MDRTPGAMDRALPMAAATARVEEAASYMRRHLYYYTLTEADFPEASVVLAGEPATWLPAARQAEGGGWLVVLSADGALPPAVETMDALVTVGPPVEHGSQVLRSVAWKGASAASLFPRLEGELVLDALTGNGCHLSLMGSYRPPLSVVGGAADAMFGHRVAEACVRRFVLDIADRLTAVGERS